MLHSMIKMSMGMVLSEKGVDRKHLLYNRKGHRSIQIRRVRKQRVKFDESKKERVDGKL